LLQTPKLKLSRQNDLSAIVYLPIFRPEIGANARSRNPEWNGGLLRCSG